MRESLNYPQFSSVSDKMKDLFIYILTTLKSSKNKLRLAIVNFSSLSKGVLGEDCMIGLEMDANNEVKIQKQIL